MLFRSDEIEKRIKSAHMPKEARKKAEAELKKLRLMSPMSAEATVVRNYIEAIVNLPWKKRSKISTDLGAAERVLDEDHYGLEKVKERIVEYLAVQTRVRKLKGPILCLVGPPGVGKTSLGESIARSTNRKFVRMALGGVRDEAEIRGHRRTYIGSMPDIPAPATVTGNLERGAELYRDCANCHGADGMGIAMNAPRMTGISDWYLLKQLNNFKVGIRGTHPADLHGKQMGFMARMLLNDQDMRDVVAYINAL